MRWALLFAGVCGTLAAIGALLWCGMSLWLPWHMLPAAPGSIRVAMVTNLLPSRSIEVISGISDEYMYSLAWEQSPQGRQIVVLPKLLRQEAATIALRQGGYMVERQGIFLRGYTTPGAGAGPVVWPRLTEITKRMLHSITIAPMPLMPSLIAAGGETHSVLAPGGVAVATLHDQSLHGLLKQAAPAAASSREIVPAHTMFAEGVTVTVPAALLERIPAAQIDVWEREIDARLAFELTKPNIMGELRAFEEATISIGEADGGVAVTGNSAQFLDIARQWVEEEERRFRPQARAFRLPDGTIGREQVPGNPEAAFSASPQNDCYSPVAGKTTLWLCEKGNRAALASSETLARDLLSNVSPPINAVLGGKWLQQAQGLLGCATDPTALFCTAMRWQLQGTTERLQFVTNS